MRLRWLPVALSAVLSASVAAAQMLPVGDVAEDYLRLLEISGRVPLESHTIRPLSHTSVSAPLGGAQTHPWQEVLHPAPSPEGPLAYGIYDPEVLGIVNTQRPWGMNHSAVWAGKGSTIAASAGGFMRIGPLTASARPVVVYNQNAEFELNPIPAFSSRSPFSQPVLTGNIDLPQRFGEEPFATFDLGESYVRLDYAGIAAGLSNENMWWGPGIRNAILMTNNAPGFPHGFLGTSGPASVGIGRAQARWIWGILTESDHFDFDPSNDRRFLTALAFDFSPDFAPGLTVGGTRAFNVNMPDGAPPEAAGYFLVFQGLFKSGFASDDNPTGDDPDRVATDQMLSLFARWVLPASGLELYGEIGKGDHSFDIRDAFVSPEHATGYVLGLQKSFELGADQLLRMGYEQASLEAPRTRHLRANVGGGYFYTHSRIIQGYSQRGQVIGAGIGPGGSEQFLSGDLFGRWGRVGGFAGRTVHNADRFQAWVRHTQPFPFLHYRPEVELTLGARAHLFYQGFEVGGVVAVGHLYNQHYVYQNDQTNLNFQITLRYGLMGHR